MNDDREARIRERAYRIWESEGRPDDRHQVHWDIAARIIDEEDATGPQTLSDLDKAVADSFPASDPPAASEPTTGVGSDPSALNPTGSPRRRRA